MTDLETLRSALREPPPESFSTPDLAKIMAEGGRIRRRRRLATAGGVAAAVAAVIVVVFGAGQLGRSGMVSPPAAAPTLSVVASAPTSVSTPTEKHTRLGDVVDTGMKSPNGELVLYAVQVDVPTAPGVNFAMMAGNRDAAGNVTDLYIGNQTSGSDTALGFHSLNATLEANGQFIPTFGYYVGPAAKITTTVHGKVVQAQLSPWSENNNVKIFWFSQQDLPDSNLMTPPSAYDSGNQRIPNGK